MVIRARGKGPARQRNGHRRRHRLLHRDGQHHRRPGAHRSVDHRPAGPVRRRGDLRRQRQVARPVRQLHLGPVHRRRVRAPIWPRLDGEPTIEIPVVGLEDPPDWPRRRRARRVSAGRPARAPARTADRAVRVLAAPPTSAQPHVQVLGALLPVVLKRYWPVLLGGALGVAGREPDHPEPSRTVSAPRVGVVVNVCVALHRDGPLAAHRTRTAGRPRPEQRSAWSAATSSPTSSATVGTGAARSAHPGEQRAPGGAGGDRESS